MNHKNSFSNFIYQEHALNVTADIEEKLQAQSERELKPVTVRLHPDQIKTIDNIAEYLGVSRQKFLSEGIDGAISLAIDAIAAADCGHRVGFTDLDESKKQEMIEKTRTKLIKELVA